VQLLPDTPEEVMVVELEIERRVREMNVSRVQVEIHATREHPQERLMCSTAVIDKKIGRCYDISYLLLGFTIERAEANVMRFQALREEDERALFVNIICFHAVKECIDELIVILFLATRPEQLEQGCIVPERREAQHVLEPDHPVTATLGVARHRAITESDSELGHGNVASFTSPLEDQ
jgi:hypothetical protein